MESSQSKLLMPMLLLALAASFITSLLSGDMSINLVAAVKEYLSEETTAQSIILFEIRLPRALLAAMTGATLGLAGAAMQGLLRNPLAEPGIVGVSNCAALGAVIVFYFGLTSLGWFMLPLGGLIGASISVILIFLLSWKTTNTLSLILAGIAINAIAGALIALALNFAPNPYAMLEIVFWMLGSVANKSMNDVYIALPFVLLGCSLLIFSARFINALSLGEDSAETLGFNVNKLRGIMVLGVAASVGACVSVTGNIGFVGLVIPHMLRPFVAYEPGKLLLGSAIAGASLLLLADVLVKLLSTNSDLKLGVLTALIGGPFFLALILKSRTESWS